MTGEEDPPVEQPSDDLAPVAGESRMPGEHRGGFSRLPTGPLGITGMTAPPEPSVAPSTDVWSTPAPRLRSVLSGWALGIAILGLVVSFFVGWAFPLGLVAIVVAVMALRRLVEDRAMAIWAICIASASVIYSVGWLVFAAYSASLFS
ncbi:hypothetical protein R2Q81_02010 [Microbacterium aquimaris]|uniref:hypothetical protein n=1 Tax=Microbacterium aquimaris TaxID=459816 RepID=UPI002AD1D75A|nr:hypothetical protein [Microbacterium aquimaris]MDZ8274714.1 hypothetical protein [Microbacterium aquimaris]